MVYHAVIFDMKILKYIGLITVVKMQSDIVP